MKRCLTQVGPWLVVLLPLFGALPLSAVERPRLAVLTDIGGDPDDQQSLVRLMVYANEFEIEALIASASGTPGELKQAITRPDRIRQTIDAYEKALPNLKRRAAGWPEVNGAAHRVDNSASWTTTSDRWLKQHIEPVSDGLSLVEKLRPVNFLYTPEYRAGHPGLPSAPQFGVLAQDFQQVFPDFVETNSAGYLTINPSPLTFVNTAAIQDLNRKLEEQKAANTDLKARLEKLEQLLAPKLAGGAQ
jgi:hypothetical protein